MTASTVKNIAPKNTTHARLLFGKTVQFQLMNSTNVKRGVVGSTFRGGVCIDGKHYAFDNISHMCM